MKNIYFYSPVVLGLLSESEFGKLLLDGGTGGPFTSLLLEAPIFLPESTEFRLLLDANEFDEWKMGETPPRFGGGGGCEKDGVLDTLDGS
jgi:hypothetical protein